jgi:hypothetical protein
LFVYAKSGLVDLDWVPIHIAIHAYEKFISTFFHLSVKYLISVWILPKSVGFFFVSNHVLKPQLRRSGKIQVRVLGEVDIYLCIDNSYGLNGHVRVENVLEFNPIKRLGEKHDFT